jgi:hypothetical protein
VGESIPYGRGEERPARTDMYVEVDVAPDEVERRVHTASILHSNGDGLDIADR